MKTYAKSIEDRKALVGRLKELTGQDSIYTRVPRCAYIVGDFVVEKDGTMTADEGADETVIQTLQQEEMIGAEITAPVNTPARRMPTFIPQPAAEITTASNVIGTQDWEPETSATEEAQADEPEQEVWQPEDDLFPLASERNTGTSREDAEPEEEQTVEETNGDGFPMDLSVSLPLSKHTANSVVNLVCMMCARGPLLTLATGGDFGADKELADALLDAPLFLNADAVVKFILARENHESELRGMRFEDGKVVFDGFKAVPDREHMEVYMRLAANMNKMAITQQRIQPKTVNAENEKYALRIWLVRLGMNGDDFKLDRKILMERLSGHAAFRTDAEREKWTARQNAKRDALRAAKEAAGE